MAENIASIATTAALMEKYGLHARKKYGQNFLVSGHAVERIVKLVNPAGKVIEIGPGLGALSEKLAERCPVYQGYEIDGDLVAVLHQELPQLCIYHQDFLQAEMPEGNGWTLVSNLPYYITTDLLWKIYCHAGQFEKVIVMVQKEVARKFIVNEQGKDYNALSVLLNYYSTAEPVCQVSRNEFIPRPNVDSTVICFTMNKGESMIYDRRFTDLVEQAFSQRRKKLLTNLKELGVNADMLQKCGLPETARAEELSAADYVRLYEVLYG